MNNFMEREDKNNRTWGERKLGVTEFSGNHERVQYCNSNIVITG